MQSGIESFLIAVFHRARPFLRLGAPARIWAPQVAAPAVTTRRKTR